MTSRPASTGSATPVIQRASSLARKTAAQATSHPVPSVPSGAASRRRSRSASSMRGATIGPYTSPGTMQLTRMPCRPWSPAIERVMPTTAAFEVEYGVLWLARRPAMEEMLMIEPPPARIMWGIAYLLVSMMLLTLIAITRSHCSSVTSSTSARTDTPTLLSRMSSRRATVFVERAIREQETRHAGQIRLAVESALFLLATVQLEPSSNASGAREVDRGLHDDPAPGAVHRQQCRRCSARVLLAWARGAAPIANGSQRLAVSTAHAIRARARCGS